MNDTNKQQQQQATSVPISSESGSSPGPYSVAPSQMTDSMSRYGQAGAVGMGPETLAVSRNPAPGSGPAGQPPPSALSPWQGYVYSVDHSGRAIQPFPGQPYRAPYPAFPGQYSEPYDQYLGGPLPPDYPLNIRYAGEKGTGGGGGGGGGGAATGGLENNGGMGYTLMDNRASSALPPFSSIATHPTSGRGSTPGLKEDMGDFNEGLGARLSRGGSSSAPASAHPGEFGEGLTARLIERGMNPRDENFHSSPSLVQYRPWEIGSGPRSEPPSSSHASPTSPSSSYSFAEGFLKFQPGTPTGDKGGPPEGGSGGVRPSNTNSTSAGNGSGNGNDGNSHAANSNNDKTAWFHGKSEALSPYPKDTNAVPPPSDKHIGKEGNGGTGNGTGVGAKNSGANDMLSGANIGHSEPNRPPPPNSVGYSSDSTTGGDESKSHLTNSYPPYDGRDMLLSFGSPHTAAAYDYYPPTTAASGVSGSWGYPEMGKEQQYHAAGRPYNQNGRENVYGNGNPSDRAYQLSPHDKMSLQNTATPSAPPPSSTGGGYQGNTHVPIHTATTTTTTTKGKRGRGGGRGGHRHHVGQVPSVSSTNQAHSEYGPPSKQMAVASDESGAGSDKPKKKKRKRCGECYGCQRKDNCGECAPCRNEKSHQICKQRRCEKLIERKNSNAPQQHAQQPQQQQQQQQQQAPPPPPSPHVQPQPPPPPTVAEKLQYLGGTGAGTAWW